jgi:sugar phosphate isomerase/epimerase
VGLPVGLGLYTVAEDLGRDWEGTLSKVAAMGYREVELSTFTVPDAGTVGRSLKTSGLRATSAHLRPGEPLEAQIELAKEIGCPCLVQSAPDVDLARLSGLSGSDAMKAYVAALEALTVDGWRANAEGLRRKAEVVRRAGLRFAYHTHGIDFRRFGDLSAFDVTIRETDPGAVEIQLDCGWAVNAGIDPVDLFVRHPGRIRTLHIKDVRRGLEPTPRFDIRTTRIGQGAVDWSRLLTAAREAGVERAFVELEPPYVEYTALEAARSAREYLSALTI